MEVYSTYRIPLSDIINAYQMLPMALLMEIKLPEHAPKHLLPFRTEDRNVAIFSLRKTSLPFGT
jgi:hypothetical protein